jgi:NitT/TauT family transport system ATP-binding protein
MVFQQYSSLEWFSVLTNVALPLILKGVSKKEAEEKAMEMIKVVGLEGHENKFAKMPQLSGGQLQRVAIARCLVANPNMLMLDEPYGALDGFTRAKMQFFLLDIFQKRELADLNPTVVLVTHDPVRLYCSVMIFILWMQIRPHSKTLSNPIFLKPVTAPYGNIPVYEIVSYIEDVIEGTIQ